MQLFIFIGAFLFPFLFAGHTPASEEPTAIGYSFVTVNDDEESWLGVSIQDMSPSLAKSMKTKTEEGALVNDVVDDSPAKSAGIKDEDVIVEFNGKVIADGGDLIREVKKVDPGTKVNVVVMRDDERKSFQVTVGKTPDRPRAHTYSYRMPHPPRVRMFVSREALGLTLQELTDQLGEYFGAPDNQGILITEVEKESSAEKAGFKAGDVITKVGKKTVRDLDDIWDEVGKYKEGEKINFGILRKGGTLTLPLEAGDLDMDPMMHWHRAPHSSMNYDFNFDGDCFDDWGNGIDIMINKEIQRELERVQPRLDRLKIEMNQMGRQIRDQIQEFKKKTRRMADSIGNQV